MTERPASYKNMRTRGHHRGLFVSEEVGQIKSHQFGILDIPMLLLTNIQSMEIGLT